jgi:hypothetical protein
VAVERGARSFHASPASPHERLAGEASRERVVHGRPALLLWSRSSGFGQAARRSYVSRKCNFGAAAETFNTFVLAAEDLG